MNMKNMIRYEIVTVSKNKENLITHCFIDDGLNSVALMMALTTTVALHVFKFSDQHSIANRHCFENVFFFWTGISGFDYLE